MLKSCAYCGRIHDSKFDCGKKPKKNFKKKWTNQSEFRSSKAWQQKRDSIRERDCNMCQVCYRILFNTINQFNFENLSVHHNIPIEEDYGLRLEDSNLITLCSRHHEMAEAGIIPRELIQSIILEQEVKKDERLKG